MKRKGIKLLVLIGTLTTLTTGCGPKSECDVCGEMARCKPGKLYSEEINVCGDCKSDIEMLGLDRSFLEIQYGYTPD